MDRTGEVRILTRDTLELPVWQERAKYSVKMTFDVQTKERTEESEAQEALVNFIFNLGGVRQDVYEFLLFPRFKSTVQVASVRTLLCMAASVEWLMLAAAAIEKDDISGVMYVEEITEAYKNGMALEKVREILEKSGTAFEMCQYRIHHADLTLPDKMTQSDVEHLAQTVKAAVLTAMREFMEENQGNPVPWGYEGKKEVQKDAAEQNQVPALPVEREWNEPVINKPEEKEQKENKQEEIAEDLLHNMVEKMEEIPDFPDGNEIMDGRILMAELTEEEKKYGQRISFFQILLNKHMRKAFAKLDEKEQMGKIFEIMVERKYGKEKILNIRRLMNGGMSNEFIFSLLEKEYSQEELSELTEALLSENLPEKSRRDVGEEEDEQEKDGTEETV